MKNPKRKQPEKCQFCGLDPRKPEHKGRQVYACDKCEALVCSDCSLDGPGAGQVYCKDCDYEYQLEQAEKMEGQPEREPDRCSRCDAIISRTRADRFSICETCEVCRGAEAR